jgi:hypothetical protein
MQPENRKEELDKCIEQLRLATTGLREVALPTGADFHVGLLPVAALLHSSNVFNLCYLNDDLVL